MKEKWLALSSLFLISPAIAQTCGAPIPFNTPPGGPAATGTTCGAADDVALYCGAQDSVNKPDVIYRFNLLPPGPGRTSTSIVVAGGSAGFTPTIFLYSAACVTGDGCAQTGEPGFPMDLTSVGAGVYNLAVSASTIDPANACGNYSIITNGTLPVELKSFSIQ